MSGPSGLIDRLLDDDPSLRGQRLWVMFALSVLLVAAMNAYAMVREPQKVAVEDLVEHTNEVVSIEGTVISWVEDPYSSGDNRVDIIIEDDTGVAELRWYRFGEIPMLGTKVLVTGDVIEYEGRIWLQALGSGALQWDDEDIPAAPVIGISTIAADPSAFLSQTFTISGYLSKAVGPDATFTALYLGDHPEYGNSEHQMRMIIHSAPGQWLESGQKVEVTAVVQYEQRELRWSIHVQGPEIRVDRTHTPLPSEITWGNYASWSFQSGNLVKLDGIIVDSTITDGKGLSACLLNVDGLDSVQGKNVTFAGRLLWSTLSDGWCLDASVQGSVELLEIDNVTHVLEDLVTDPVGTYAAMENNTHYIISGFAYSSRLMSTTGETMIIISDGVYPNLNVKMDAIVPIGMHEGWIEDGQELLANVTVSWNNESAEFQLNVHELTLIGPVPNPVSLPLTGGAPEWYELNKLTSIVGNLVTIENETYLQKEGGEQRILVNVVPGSIGANEYHENMTLEWVGRLIEIPDNTNLSHRYLLDNADVIDEDEDGIADDAQE